MSQTTTYRQACPLAMVDCFWLPVFLLKVGRGRFQTRPYSTLTNAGNERQKQELLPRLARGQVMFAISITESPPSPTKWC